MAQKLNRREFLRLAGMGGAALLGGQAVFGWLDGQAAPAPTATPMPSMPGMNMNPKPTPAAGGFTPDAEFSLAANEKSVQLLPGTSTRVWGYEGKLTSGSGVTVSEIPNSYLGPVVRIKSGTRVRINIKNNLPEETVLHPHGLRVPEECDGSPMRPSAPGTTQVYEFQFIDRAGPYWFHPHPMMGTPEQVYRGMAGVFYVWDEEEAQAVPGASTGENDIPVIIQDRSFDANNQLLYMPNMMWGFLGDRMLVNGTVDARCGLEPRSYRLRILNGSNARAYKLAWSNGMPLLVIGTDGGLLPEAVSRSYVTLMPGERVDVWADFSRLAGQQVVLKSLPFSAGMMGGGMGMGMGGMRGGGMRGGMGGPNMGMGMMGGMGPANGAALNILTVNVGAKATTQPVLGRMPKLEKRFDASNVANFNTPTPFVIGMGMMMRWTINGKVYDMNDVAADEKVKLGEPTAWEFINLSPIPHPMHLHNIQFQVVQRTASAAAGYAEVNQGFVDSGWKDTVTVWPGERVKIAMEFGPHSGLYMYHCHILEHEAMGMMRNLQVLP